VKAALIDLDGTLLDTAPDLAAAANATLRELGLPEIAPAAVGDYVGKGIAHLMKKSLEAALGRAPEPALFERAQSVFAGHYERVNGAAARPFPGVVEGLEAMRAHALKLACVTNKVARFTQPLLAKTRLHCYFDAVVTSDIAGARKPDPAVFLYACRALGVAPFEAGVIGDSDNDGEAARAAGCRFLLVPYGYREGKPIGEVKNDGVVDSLLDALRLLRD